MKPGRPRGNPRKVRIALGPAAATLCCRKRCHKKSAQPPHRLRGRHGRPWWAKFGAPQQGGIACATSGNPPASCANTKPR